MVQKKFLIVILLLLSLINVVNAEKVENYNNFKTLEIGININSSVTLEKTAPNPRLDHLTTNLIFYPQKSYAIDIEYNNPYSNPIAEIEKNEEITYKWKTIDYTKLIFGIDSKVKTYNDPIKIRSKVNFPITGLSNEIKKYTNPTENIDLNDKIKEKAQEIVSGETDVYIVAFKIAEWVRNNVKYDLNTLTAEAVQKSSWVYDNREGVCDEITSLFISMLRSVGIPARFVSGIVYTNVLYDFGSHGWAEVFFPGYGWVPFDVTFGQYGFLDPSHVKFYASNDSKNNAITSTSLSYGINTNLSKYIFSAKVINSNGEVLPLAKISVLPIKEEVGFGSYVPLEVKIENLQDYYLSLNLFLSKAPSTYKNDSQTIVLLKPLEKKSIFFILKIDSDLNDKYIYTSEIEVKTDFNGMAKNTLKYTKDAEFYSLERAQKIINDSLQREKKYFFSDLNFKCSSNKKDYYNDEKAFINCNLENTGNINLNINLCLLDDCKVNKIGISENKENKFIVDLKKINGKKELKISAENDKMVKYSNIEINVIKTPEISLVTDIKSIDYTENKEIIFNLTTNSKLNKIILILDKEKINLTSIEDSAIVKINLTGSKIKKDSLNLKLNYSDELNKTYSEDFLFKIKVNNTPWYIKLYDFFS